MDGSGFWVSIRAKTLSSGKLRVKISTIELVLGKHCVPAVGGRPLEVTLTDSDDATSWPVLLSAHGDGCCSITGLKVWMRHRNAVEQDKVVVNRQADGSSPKNLLRLVRAGAAETLRAAPGFDSAQQQQQVQQIAESAMGSVSTLCAAREPRSAAPASDMAAAAAAAATAPQARPEDDSAVASRYSDNCDRPCAQPDAFPQYLLSTGRGDGRPGEPPSRLPGAMGPGGGPQHRSCTSTVPRSDSIDTGVVQRKLEPEVGGAEQQQQQLHGELHPPQEVHSPAPAPAGDEGHLVTQPHPMQAESARSHEAAPDHHRLLIAPHSAAHLEPPVVLIKTEAEPAVGYGRRGEQQAGRQEDVQQWDQDRSQAHGHAWQQWMHVPATSGDMPHNGCELEADAAHGAALPGHPRQLQQQHDTGRLAEAPGPTPPGDCWQAGSPFAHPRGMSPAPGGQLGAGGLGPAVEVQQQQLAGADCEHGMQADGSQPLADGGRNPARDAAAASAAAAPGADDGVRPSTAPAAADEGVVVRYRRGWVTLPVAARTWFPPSTAAAAGTGTARQHVRVYGRGAASNSGGSGGEGSAVGAGAWGGRGGEQLRCFDATITEHRGKQSWLSGMAGLAAWVGLEDEDWVRLRRRELAPGELAPGQQELGAGELVVVVERFVGNRSAHEETVGPAVRRIATEEGASRGQLCSGSVSEEARAGVGGPAAGAVGTRVGSGSAAGEPRRALYLKGALHLGLPSASALWPGWAEGLPFKEHHTVTLYTQGIQGLRAHPVRLVRYKQYDFRLGRAQLAARDVGVREREAVGLRRLPCGRLLVEAWQGQGQRVPPQQRRAQRSGGATKGDARGSGTEGGWESASGTEEEDDDQDSEAPQKQPGVQGATVEGAVAVQRVAVKQEPDAGAGSGPTPSAAPLLAAAPSSGPSGLGPAAGRREQGAGGSAPAGAPPPPPQHGGVQGEQQRKGGSSQPVERRGDDAIAEAAGGPSAATAAAAASAQAPSLAAGNVLSTYAVKFRASMIRVPKGARAWFGTATETAVAAAPRPVNVYGRAPVGGGTGGGRLQRFEINLCTSYAHTLTRVTALAKWAGIANEDWVRLRRRVVAPGELVAGEQEPGAGELVVVVERGEECEVSGAAATSPAGASRRSVAVKRPSGGPPCQDPASRCRTGGGDVAVDRAAGGRVMRPGGNGPGQPWRALYLKGALLLGLPSASALWPGWAEGLPFKEHHTVTLYTRGAQGLRAHPVRLVRYKQGDFRLGGAQLAARDVGVREREAVGLRRQPCGRLLVEAWQGQGPQQGQVQGPQQGQGQGPQQGQVQGGLQGQRVVKLLTAAGAAEGDARGLGTEGGGRCDTEPPAVAAGGAGARLAPRVRGSAGDSAGSEPGAGQECPVAGGVAGPGGQRGSCAGGAAWRAVNYSSYLHLRMPCVRALWPGVVERLPNKQHRLVTVYTRSGAGSEQLPPFHPVSAGGQVQEHGQGLRAHPAKLVRYDTGFRLLGLRLAARDVGVGDKEAVGLLRLPCGRLLVEAWQGQGQDRQGKGQEGQQQGQQELEGQQQGEVQRLPLPLQLGCAQRDGGVARHGPREAGTECDTETESARESGVDYASESEWGSELEGDGDTAFEEVEARQRQKAHANQRKRSGGSAEEGGRAWGHQPLHKRRRLQAPSGGSLGAAAGQCSQGQAARSVEQGALVAAHAPGGEAGGQAWHSVIRGGLSVLQPRVHVVQELWPELAPQLRAAEGSAEVTLHTAAYQQAGGAQLVRHAVRLSYVRNRYSITGLKGVLRVLGLGPGTREVYVRRAPDGRIMAAPPWAAAHAADPPAAPTQPQAPAQQQQVVQHTVAQAGRQRPPPRPAPALPAPPAGTARSAAPAPALRPPRPLAAAPSHTASGDRTVTLVVSGGHLFPDTPSVSLLWPRLAAMAVRNQQPVKLRVARPRAGPVDYTVRLVRFGEAVWRLERTQALARQLRLGEGDQVELAAQGGGVVGVRRAGPAKPVHRASAAEVPFAQRGTSGDGLERGRGRGSDGAGTSDGGKGRQPSVRMRAQSAEPPLQQPQQQSLNFAPGREDRGHHQLQSVAYMHQWHVEEQSAVQGLVQSHAHLVGQPEDQLSLVDVQQAQPQLQRCVQPPASAPPHLPASSLTPAHLLCCVPASVGPPPLQPGELRLCGLTFHPDMAPGVRRAMADWEAGLGGTPLHEAEPQTAQVRVLGTGQLQRADGGALMRTHRLSRTVLALRVCELLGLGEVEAWGRELPLHAPVQEGRVELRRDEQRGGWGLGAAAAVKKGHPLCVVGGYVMPAAAAERFVSLGWRDCGEGVRVELRRRVGGGGSTTRVSYGWKMLATSYCMPYHVEEGPAEGEGAITGDGGGPAHPVLCCVGYGNLGALANDPRVNPRAWQEGNDVGATHEQLQPNCGIVHVSVRGLVLPVLVALRDIASGEQLLRDYGADWWRGIAEVWEVAEDEGLVGENLFWGRGDSGGGPNSQAQPQPSAGVNLNQSQPPLRPGTLKPPPPLHELLLQATAPVCGLDQAPAHAAEVHAAMAGRSSAVAAAGVGACLPPAGGPSATAPQPRQASAGLRQQGQRTGTSRGGRSSSPRGRGRSPGRGHTRKGAAGRKGFRGMSASSSRDRGRSRSRERSRDRGRSRDRSCSRSRAYHERRRHSRSRSRGRSLGRHLRDREWSRGRASDSEPEGGRGTNRRSSQERGRGSPGGRNAGKGRSFSPVRRRFRSRSTDRRRDRGRQGPGQRGRGEGRSSSRSASRSRSRDGRRARGGRLPSPALAKVPPERHQPFEQPVLSLWPMPGPFTTAMPTAAWGSHGAVWGAPVAAPVAGVQARTVPPRASCHAMGMSGLQQLLMLGGGGQEGAVKGVSGGGGCGLPPQQAGGTAQGPAVGGAGGSGVAAAEGDKGPAGVAWW